MACSGLHKTTTQTIGYAPLFVLLFVKGLNAIFKYFERKLSNDGYGRELECKDIMQFSFKNMRKLSLVNETLRPETETFDFQSETRPRRSHISTRPRRWENAFRDRDYIPVDYNCILVESSNFVGLYPFNMRSDAI